MKVAYIFSSLKRRHHSGNIKRSKRKFALNPRASFITIMLLLYIQLVFALDADESEREKTNKKPKGKKEKLLSIVMINKHTIIENM